MPEEKKISQKHTIVMEERNKISITGVLDVLAFDEENIVTETELGMLTIKGIDLHVNKLNLEKGDLEVEGELDSVFYSQAGGYDKSKNSILARLFK
jgi:sporulation protein YabP